VKTVWVALNKRLGDGVLLASGTDICLMTNSIEVFFLIAVKLYTQ